MNSSETINHNINGDNENTSLLNDDSIRSREFEPQSARGLSINTENNINNNNDSTTQGISWYFAIFLIVNAALGAGLLNFAHAFDEAGGILVSSIVQCILAVFIIGALIILCYCTDKTKASNFQDVVYVICGKGWQNINSVCIILYMFGCCITFFIIIGDQLDQIFSCIHGPNFSDFWYFNRKFTITITSLVLILPLCYAKRIDFLTYPSMFAVIAIVYVVLLIPIKYAHANTQNVVIKTRLLIIFE